MMMYCAWNLWKERNRRVFEQKIKSPAEVIQEIKHEVHTRKLACLGPELSSTYVRPFLYRVCELDYLCNIITVTYYPCFSFLK